MTSRIPANHRYAIIYVGAPYGKGEAGCLLGTYETMASADGAMTRMGECQVRECVIVGLDDTSNPDWPCLPYDQFGDHKTARQFFGH
jgi:hypothetical protein